MPSVSFRSAHTPNERTQRALFASQLRRRSSKARCDATMMCAVAKDLVSRLRYILHVAARPFPRWVTAAVTWPCGAVANTPRPTPMDGTTQLNATAALPSFSSPAEILTERPQDASRATVVDVWLGGDVPTRLHSPPWPSYGSGLTPMNPSTGSGCELPRLQVLQLALPLATQPRPTASRKQQKLQSMTSTSGAEVSVAVALAPRRGSSSHKVTAIYYRSDSLKRPLRL